MNKAKKGLGKGLSALIPEVEESEEKVSGNVENIDIDRIKPNPYQPRKEFDEEKLNELAESIKEHGVVQPVIVTPEKNGKYVLIVGERRWKASSMAGEETIPAIVKEIEESTLLQVALIENLQREDLNPIEEATAYKRLINEFKMTQEELSRKLGKSRATIANTMRLLQLPDKLKNALLEGKINEGQARPLLAVKETQLQEEIAEKIVNNKLTARDVEKKVSQSKKKESGEDEKGVEKRKEEEIFWEELREDLQTSLGTRVRIKKNKHGGVIEIDFFGEEDLERVLSLIKGKNK